jgi:hypothetical protein
MRIGSFGDQSPDKIDKRKRDQRLDVLSNKLLNLVFWNVLNVSRSRADVVSVVLEFRVKDFFVRNNVVVIPLLVFPCIPLNCFSDFC